MAKILIIEDQQVLCQLYRSVLAQFHYSVVLANTGEAGIDAALRDRPDLIFLDLRLPGMRGTEVARKLEVLGVLPDVPLIITTALDTLEAEAIAESVNATAVLVKPFDMDLMLTTISAALARPGQKARRG